MPVHGSAPAPGSAAELAGLRDRLYRPGTTEEDVRRYRAAADRDTAALHRAEAQADEPRTARAGRVRALWLLAGAAVATGTVVLASPLPQGRPAGAASPRPSRPAAVVALRAPATDGVPLWSAHGIGSLPSSPVLEAAGTPIVVALACRGAGAILVLADNQDRRVACVDGRVSTDRELFVAPHGRFTIALSISGPVEWDLSVREVGG